MVEQEWWSAQGKVINTLGSECEEKSGRCIRAKPSTYHFTAERALTFSRQHCCDLLTVKPRGAVTGTRAACVADWAECWWWLEIKGEMCKFINADASTQGVLLRRAYMLHHLLVAEL